jgi:hypothetical protein
MVDWLAGNRIRGTSTERTSTNGFNTKVGGWVELGRTTLGSAGDTISVASLADKRYLMLLVDTTFSTGVVDKQIRFNNDSGTSYSARASNDGAGDGTQINRSGISNGSTIGGEFSVHYVSNLLNKEKLLNGHTVSLSTAGAGTAAQREERVAKWVGTPVINRVDQVNVGSGDFSTGAEVVVLGWDESDTHTTNFWEELASVELGSSGALLDSGTFTAKKYLWIQTMIIPTGGSVNTEVTYNSDTGSNYAQRVQVNGGTDVTGANQSSHGMSPSDPTPDPLFSNWFIINNSANEKLIMIHSIQQNTAGAGTAPKRIELVEKWANTSAQITKITITDSSAGSYDTGSIIKVWGSD